MKRLRRSPEAISEELQWVMDMYGFEYDKRRNQYQVRFNNSTIQVIPYGNTFEGIQDGKLTTLYNIEDLILYLDDIARTNDMLVFASVALCNPDSTNEAIMASISTRELTRNMTRVKSSNMWAYTINIKDRHDKVGDVIVQFKGNKGGPGDLYLYYDVPLNVWRRWLAAPSVGHFFWANIRNNYYYRKLTGNKKGVLKNAIN